MGDTDSQQNNWRKWFQLTLARRMALYSVIASAVTVGCLVFFSPSKSTAAESERTKSSSSATTAPATASTESRTGGRTLTAVQANQAAGAGMIYAPRDVVDMTRLVLEVSRDQALHTAHYIELATTVIVVFFSVIGAVGAAFGLHKIGDIERRADAIKEKIEADMQEKIHALHREINDQAELLTAKSEIATSGGDTFTLANAAQRIKAVLERDHISKQSRIRGLADYAYAIKRTGNVPDALLHIEKAAELARECAPKMIPLVAFNAACYSCILGQTEKALTWLKTAIEHNPDYKETAKKDGDLKSIWEADKFKTLTT